MDQLIADFLQDMELSGKTEITVLHYGYCLRRRPGALACIIPPPSGWKTTSARTAAAIGFALTFLEMG